MKWYKDIEDSDFLSNINWSSIKKPIDWHPIFRNMLGRTYNYSSYSHPSTSYDTSTFKIMGEELGHIIDMMGRALLIELIESNPTFVGVMFDRALRGSADLFKISPYATSFTPPPKPLANDDYTYWCEFNDDGDSVLITCDKWEESDKKFITEFEFDPDDDGDKLNACTKAENLIQQLISGEVQLEDLIGSGGKLAPSISIGSIGSMVMSP